MVNIIIATHGSLAIGFKDNLQTVTGESSVEALTLAQDDNSDVFEENLLCLLRDHKDEGTLLFVDFVGGTPYNLALKHLYDGLNYKVVAGINAMMLIETVGKQASFALDELYRLAIEVGKNQIQGFEESDQTESSLPEVSSEIVFHDGCISLARVDHRLMHGQVVTKWLKLADADTILIVDNEMSKDQYMVDIYQQAAPNGVAVFIVPTDVIAYAYQHNTLPNGKVLLLFRNIEAVQASMQAGLRLKTLQLGGIPNDNGKRKMVFTAVCLSQDDIETLNEIEALGTSISLQVVPEEKGITYSEALKKLGN